MTMRPVLAFAVLAITAIPAAVRADDASDLRQQILDGCDIKAWQFNVRIEQGGVIVPLLSPTMDPVARKCVMTMMDAYKRQQTTK